MPHSPRHPTKQPPEAISGWQYIIAFIFGSLACLGYLSGFDGLAPACAAIFSFSLMTARQRKHVPTRRDWWTIALGYGAIATVAFLLYHFHLNLSWLDPILHHPAFIIPLWIFMSFMLLRRWLAQALPADGSVSDESSPAGKSSQ